MTERHSFVLCDIAVVDGTGGPVREHAFLEVLGARIARIGDMADYAPRDGVEEVRLPGHYVMPGLIDAHVHLSGGRAEVDDQEIGVVAEPMGLKAMRSVYEAQQLLKRGFTTVRDISWNGFYLKRLFVEQQIPGPKVVACGPGLTRTGGHGDLFQFTPNYVAEHGVWGIVADGPEEVRKAVRRNLREGADAIKIWVSGGDNWPHDRIEDVHYSMEELRACVEEAHRQKGTIVAAHAENREAIEMAVDAGCDTIEHGEEIDEALAKKMVERGTILVPTLELIINWYRDFIPLGDEPRAPVRPEAFLYRDLYQERTEEFGEAYSAASEASFRTALAAGVKIALGSDTVYEPLTKYGEYSAREFRALVQYGMTVPQAVHAATAVSSEAVGMSHALGTLEAGKLADLLVLRADPTSGADVVYDAAHHARVYCDGKLTVRDGEFVW
ncbi:amidohydrolase family protein [Leucobacter allii]|uniref:metal-dependent hydrolase family protein n=1 Tax=Leucobacter allii TaxID=2932247 RepID=UPI001FD52155|nr:amidohydrolase family protein [Leucobacter allii]UOR00789.1 amidohydrolase family protein [Leucobacter allii]